jgi:hypothetical protein
MRRSPWVLKVFLVLLSSPWSGATAAPPAVVEFEKARAQVEAAQPDGLSMELKLPKTRFYQGEISPAKLVIKNSSKRPYYTWVGTYDRSGRIRDLSFQAIGEQGEAVVDPLKSYFEHGGGVMAGGIGNYTALGQWEIEIPVNEWLRFDKPGTYRLYGTSYRATPGSSEDHEREGAAQPKQVELVSGIVTIQIDPLPPAQEQEILAQIRKHLERPQAYEAMKRLRHLQTPAARDLLRSLLDRPCSADVSLGLHSSPDPEAEGAALLRDVRAGLLPIDQSNLYLYAALKGHHMLIQRDPILTEMLEAARETLRGDLKSAVASRNLIELFQRDPKDPATRALVVAHQLDLVDAATDSMIQMLDSAGSPTVFARMMGNGPPAGDDMQQRDFLPLVRRAAGPPRYDPKALKVLARLDPEEARKRVVEDLQHPPFKLRGHGGNAVIDFAELCSLPEEMLLPELDATFRERLRRSDRSAYDGSDGGIVASMMLLARYASPALLPDVLRMYEPGEGQWACAIQADALRYILRCDPKLGVQHLKTALAARKDTGCYTMVLTDVLKKDWHPEALPVVLAALDDPNEEVWSTAAEVLSLHAANPAVAKKMIATAERLGALPLPPRPSDQSTTIYRQDRLVKYLAEGEGWKLTREQLTRLQALPHNRADTRATLEKLLAQTAK